MQLAPGDRVFLYSDGIVEQSNAADGERFGEERLNACLQAACNRPIDEIVAGAVDALASWAGGRRFADDVTLVAMEWRGSSQTQSPSQ